MPRLNRSALLVLAAVLAACAAPPPHRGSEVRTPTAATTAAAEPHPPAGATVFHIDAQRSEIRVLVYRAGTLANLGHNHVIAFHPARGWVVWADDFTQASLRLEIPVAAALIDDPLMRREEGADFPGDIDASAREGTLHNMLSEALLDAAHFPSVSVDGVGLDGGRVALVLHLAGRDTKVVVPVDVRRDGATMTASGRWSMTQSDLGLRPFSIMMGALQVRNDMTIRFRIVANR